MHPTELYKLDGDRPGPTHGGPALRQRWFLPVLSHCTEHDQ